MHQNQLHPNHSSTYHQTADIISETEYQCELRNRLSADIYVEFCFGLKIIL
jgi:hypothetical protein